MINDFFTLYDIMFWACNVILKASFIASATGVPSIFFFPVVLRKKRLVYLNKSTNLYQITLILCLSSSYPLSRIR